MVFFIVACVNRRSTRTTTVLFCLSLTTTPWSVRFGISNLLFLRLQLGGGKRERFPGNSDRNAIDFEQDAARFHAAHPQFGGAFALSHSHFDRLFGYRHVWKDTNPHPP